MARRSWRNFDYILLGALLVLSAYGVIMIYSATINTLGVENSVQRQILYVVAGTIILLVTASIDYRLLHILQVPIGDRHKRPHLCSSVSTDGHQPVPVRADCYPGDVSLVTT